MIRKHLSIFTFSLLLLLPLSDFAQDFMFQGWSWGYPILYNGKRYAQRTAVKARELGNAGFTHIWVPPLSRGSGGSSSMGYDPQDLYDLGQYNGFVRPGTRAQIDAMVDSFATFNMEVVADMIFNHRDNGLPENNPAVEGWIKNFTNNGNCPYPSGNFRCILPLGGSSGNGPGHYYFKFSSGSNNAAYNGREYTIYAWTNKKPLTGTVLDESEPNGGGDCAQPHDTLDVGNAIRVVLETGSGCGTDEFLIRLDTSNFNLTGDTLYVSMPNKNLNLGYYTDHRPYGIWSGFASADVLNSLRIQTYTDFTKMPSGRGGMNWNSFKPNGAPTTLCGDQDGMWFFYDYDQFAAPARDSLFAWTRWMWEDVGVHGMRVDAIKHFPASFIGDLLDYMHSHNHNPSMMVGEYFDYNAFTLKGWIDGVTASMDASTLQATQPKIFDFPLRNSLKSACDAFGYDVRNVFKESTRDKAGVSGFNLVTFVNNHDYDDTNQLIANDPKLAYAYILTNNQLGIPCVFEKDYYGPPTDTANNIRREINALIQVHQKYIYGAQWADYLSRQGTPYAANYISGYPHTTLLYQLSNAISGRDVIVCINFAGDTLKLDHNINGTNLLPGDTLTDIFGVSPFAYQTVKSSYGAYFQVPPRSFAVWVEGNLTDSVISLSSIQPQTLNISNYLQVSPNPFQDELHISLRQGVWENATAELVDMQGRVVKRVVLPPYSQQFDFPTQELTKGVYALVITDGDKRYTQKVAK